jgi:crotonobetainyl-CoA:carnitine CoA-transferase CaiB-like acyl-CoA transferase
LDRLISAWTRERDRDAIAEALQQAGVAAWPSLRTQELTAYPPNVRRGSYIQVDHPTRAGEVQPGFHWRMHGTPARVMRRAPYLGEHNEDIVCGLLGVGREEFDRLVEAQVIY